jgi:aminoglycoside phosphotransferase (APT) family kinase protein
MTARVQPAPGVLASGLCHRLPGLAAALDADLMAEGVARRLLPPTARVEQATVGTAWWREDGSCSLRYRLLVADGDAARWVTVLARVHADRAGPTLSVFPHDPDLPTLPRAMEPARVRRLLQAVRPGTAGPGRDAGAQAPTVEVVRHPRAGACVLRYGLGGTGLFGKVYGDASGARAYRSLRALSEAPGPRVPVPVLYAAALRLLVTAALPGVPLVARLRDGVGVEPAVAAAGRALASLHRLPAPAGPVHSAAVEAGALTRELEVVAGVWPDAAERVRRSLAAALAQPPPGGAPVLSHGDLTPSQVLLDGATAALVDLDDLCWADPARDLGRFLAHLEMRLARTADTQRGSTAGRLAAAFLSGYRHDAASGRGMPAVPARLGFYRATSLARTALHACRALKDERLARALSLLEAGDGWTGGATP